MLFKNKAKGKFSKNLDDNINCFRSGHLSYLTLVFCVFSEGNDDAKLKAARFLAELIDAKTFKGLLQLTENLRCTLYSSYFSGDVYSINWRNIGITDLLTPEMSEDERKAVLIFASFHASGFIREIAVKQLMFYENTLKYIVLRYNDWVEQVQNAAQDAFKYVLSHFSAGELADAIPAVERLMLGGRNDFSSFYESFINLIRKNGKELAFGLKSKQPDVRLFCARLFLQDDGRRDFSGVRQDALTEYLHKEKLPHNRAVICGEYLKSGVDIPDNVLSLMLSDRFAKIRVSALDYLINTTGRDERAYDIALKFLLDANDSVRMSARYIVSRLKPEFSFRNFYSDSLSDVSAGAILGLGETGSRDDAKTVEPFLNASNSRVVCAAMSAVCCLDGDKYAGKIVDFLNDERTRVVRAAAKILLPDAQKYAKEINDIFKAASIQYSRLKCAQLLFSVSKWDALIYMLNAFDDSDNIVSFLAQNAIDRWIARFNCSFVQPTAAQRKTLQLLLAQIKRKDLPKNTLLYFLN